MFKSKLWMIALTGLFFYQFDLNALGADSQHRPDADSSAGADAGNGDSSADDLNVPPVIDDEPVDGDDSSDDLFHDSPDWGATPGEPKQDDSVDTGTTSGGNRANPSSGHFDVGSTSDGLSQGELQFGDSADSLGSSDPADQSDDPGDPCAGTDIDGDGSVDIDDFMEVIMGLDTLCAGPTPGSCKADVNGDGQTDIDDLIEIIMHYGQKCS